MPPKDDVSKSEYAGLHKFRRMRIWETHHHSGIVWDKTPMLIRSDVIVESRVNVRRRHLSRCVVGLGLRGSDSPPLWLVYFAVHYFNVGEPGINFRGIVATGT